MKRKKTTIRPKDPRETQEIEGLMQKYVQEIGKEIEKIEQMKRVIRELILRGTSPQELVTWAIEAGHDEEFVRSTLAEILPHALDGVTIFPKPEKDREKGQQ